MPIPPEVAGHWECVWGPATDISGSVAGANLMYIVVLNDTTPGAEGPAFAVVVLRGTDLNLDRLADLEQIADDMEVWQQVPWAYPFTSGSPPGNVALGTNTALGLLVQSTPPDGMPGAGMNLLQFLQKLEENNPGLPVVVTGHSLGGCLTTVTAPYLAYEFKQAGVVVDILANPFAPPTAGDRDFAVQYLASLSKNPAYLSGSAVWYNTHDPAPYVWNRDRTSPLNVHALKGLWSSNPQAKQIPDALVLTLADLPGNKQYAQPIFSPGRENVVTIPVQTADLADQFVAQHFPLDKKFPNAGYWKAIGSQPGPGAIDPPPYGATAITSLSLDGSGENTAISVLGRGFPSSPTGLTDGLPGVVNEFSFVNLSRKGWSGGWTNPSQKDDPNKVTIKYSAWSSNAISTSGFGGAYGSKGRDHDWNVESGDRVQVHIYDHTGKTLLACAECKAP